MYSADILKLRAKLLRQRWDCLRRFQGLQEDWSPLGEREPELEEEAQKLDISGPYHRLDEQRMEELEEIDLALCRMAAGTYGICEACDRLILPARLETLPATRLCHGCACRYEERKKRLPKASSAVICEGLPSEYQDFSDEELAEAVLERLGADGRLDLEELEVHCRRGVVYLEGAIPGLPEHEIVMQILTDGMGLNALVDHLQINELLWESEERTPPEVPSSTLEAAPPEPEDEEIPLVVPEGPPPEKE